MCVVSALPFSPVFPWTQIVQVPKAAARLTSQMAEASSAVCVFDTWLGNTDRANGGNLLVNQSDPNIPVRLAYIDYARSMSFAWRHGVPATIQKAVAAFPLGCQADSVAVWRTVRAIEALDDDDIKSAVARIPEAFITSQRRSCVIEGLLVRRSELASVMRVRYGTEA